MNKYKVVIIGAGPGGIFTAYELVKNGLNDILVLESGNPLSERKCPATKSGICADCKSCSIMTGFGGAGAFSDGKYNITNQFGGNLHEYIGEDTALELMEYVDKINLEFCPEQPKLYTSDSNLSSECLKHDLHLLEAKVRHLGTDLNYKILENMYKYLVDNNVEFRFNCTASGFIPTDNYCEVIIKNEDEPIRCDYCVVSAGRSGSKWVERMCKSWSIETTQNRVDIGVRVELPSEVFKHITDEVYEGKIVYRTKQYSDLVRTFCMNPKGSVVVENTNGIVTVNGHSYEDASLQTQNTNFALLVNKSMTEPFNNSNEYGEAIAKLSNMLGGGVIVQRFGDLVKGRRSTKSRMSKSFTKPTLEATPGDLSLVIPKRILDDIIEMIYALDTIAPGTANDDTLLYGVEVKFYNMEVKVDSSLKTKYNSLYIIGDGSGITHSLSHASASGVHVARSILDRVSK